MTPKTFVNQNYSFIKNESEYDNPVYERMLLYPVLRTVQDEIERQKEVDDISSEMDLFSFLK